MRINKLNKTLLVWLKCVGADNICEMLHYCIIGHSKMSSQFTTEITIDQNLVLAASCDLVSFIITIIMIINYYLIIIIINIIIIRYICMAQFP